MNFKDQDVTEKILNIMENCTQRLQLIEKQKGYLNELRRQQKKILRRQQNNNTQGP
jgi:hypothetical protein